MGFAQILSKNVQSIISEGCPINLIGVSPINFIGGLKSKIFCSENSFFFIHGKCMCEGVGEESRHGAWHVDI